MSTLCINMAGWSLRHAGDDEKPNEDVFAMDAPRGIAVVADGVGRPRDRTGRYPVEIATVAPELAVRVVAESLANASSFDHPELTIRYAMEAANAAIARTNAVRGITAQADLEFVDLLGTTATVLWVTDEHTAAIGYIGDTVALHFPHGGTPRLVSRDQLVSCHAYTYPLFNELAQQHGWSREETSRQRVIWQRKHARNQKGARDPSGNPIGFGVLTGEPGALDFIETATVACVPGDRFLLASDALIVLERPPGTMQTEPYAVIADIAWDPDMATVVRRLLTETRREEQRQGRRSDDATVVLAEITTL